MTYDVGESVGYNPPGGPLGVFTIIRRMPNEPSGERMYRIKSDLEFCERNVLESALTKLTPSPMAWDEASHLPEKFVSCCAYSRARPL
jgi:hypothetical protein